MAGVEQTALVTLRSRLHLQDGETRAMYRTLDKEITNAAILIRANHQTVNVYLDGEALYLDWETEASGDVRWQNLTLGVFAMIWALYYICTEYIVFQFFTPGAI